MREEARMDEEKGRVLPFDCRTNCIRLGFLTAQVESAVRCPILCARHGAGFLGSDAQARSGHYDAALSYIFRPVPFPLLCILV